MKYIATTLIYISFFTLIGGAVYVTGSEYPLWALILTPVLTIGINDWL